MVVGVGRLDDDGNLTSRGFCEFNLNDDDFLDFKERHKDYLGFEDMFCEYIFHLCNWYHWSDTKPSKLDSDIDSIGHGLLVENVFGDGWYLSKPTCWFHGSFDECVDFIKRNKGKVAYKWQ